MTTLGKILVFVNLLFSLMTGALIILAFTTRTNWSQAYKHEHDQLERVSERLKDKVSERAEVEKELKAEMDKLKAETAQAQKALVDAQKAKTAAEDNENKAKQERDQQAGQVTKLQSVVAGLKVEIDTLDKRLGEEQKRVLELGLESKKHKSEAIKATTDLGTALERNEQLLQKLVEADRKIAFLEGDTAAKAGREAKNPPPEDVRGRVTASDDSSGFITINLGSDNGITKGNTLEVYRLKPKPTYVGTFRVYDVRPNEAVGKLMGTGPRGKVLKDDEVASRILGSP